MSHNNSGSSNRGLSFDLFNEHEDYSETQFLKSSIANHTKYGSTAAVPSTNFQYITHYVEPSDTLQGLALKYGCKIEHIKKCNKLFSDDNNYLRSRFTLLMPIEYSRSSPLQSSSSSQESASSLDGNIPLNSPGILPANQPSKTSLKHSTSQVLEKSAKASKTTVTKKQTSLCDTQDPPNNDAESIADFLIRIDSSIAASKRETSKIVKKTDFVEADNSWLPASSSHFRFNAPKPTSEGKFLSSTSSSSGSILDDVSGIATNSSSSSNNKKLSKKAMYRYEKAHDEIFEL